MHFRCPMENCSPYYDMLVVNALGEFGDLMYYVGRIEDGIKRGKIVDTEATTFGKKGNVPNKHVEEPNRRKFEAMGESVGNLFHSIPHVPKCPLSDVFRPKSSHENMIKGLTRAITRARKGK